MTANAQIQLFADAAGNINWRLLAGNNREAGRGVVLAADSTACMSSIEQLRVSLPDAAARVRRADAHRWRWELTVDGAALAISGRTFDRMVRCEHAASQFVGLFREAQLRPGVLSAGARRFERAAS